MYAKFSVDAEINAMLAQIVVRSAKVFELCINE